MFDDAIAPKLLNYTIQNFITSKIMNKYYRLSIAISFLIGLTAYSAPTHNIRDNQAIASENIEEKLLSISRSPTTLLIWKIGDPGQSSLPDTDIPADLRQRAKKLNYNIDVEAVSAKSVTAKLRKAIRLNREPDIITYRNWGVIEGTETGLEKLAGIYSIDGVRDSSVFVNNTLKSLKANALLLDTSVNHDIARQLALPELECGNTAETKSIGNVDRDTIEEFALNYARALFSQSKTEFRKYLSKSAIVGLKSGNMTGAPQKDIEICSIVANDNLAAVSTTIAHDGRGAIGHVDLLMVLHQENDNWRLLTQQLGSNEDFKPYINQLANAIADSQQSSSQPSPASNLTPENVRPKPAEGERFGKFTWQPSQSDNVVAEIVEFAPGINARLFVKFRDDRVAIEDSISAGGLYHIQGNINDQTWHWRVWSIAADGSIAFSETQTFQDD